MLSYIISVMKMSFLWALKVTHGASPRVMIPPDQSVKSQSGQLDGPSQGLAFVLQSQCLTMTGITLTSYYTAGALSMEMSLLNTTSCYCGAAYGGVSPIQAS